MTQDSTSSSYTNHLRNLLFHHHDIQSVTLEIGPVSSNNFIERKNVSTGASKANSCNNTGSIVSKIENDLVASCPYFINEIYSSQQQQSTNGVSSSIVQILDELPQNQHHRNNNSLIENHQIGSNYYRKYFFNQPHDNWFALDEENNMGPISVSVKKEKKGCGEGYYYRVVCRRSELQTLRGAISESQILPLISKNWKTYNEAKNYSKEVVLTLFPWIKERTLRYSGSNSTPPHQPPSSSSSTKTPQTTLLTLDEQTQTIRHKIGVLYCAPGQSTEEEFYNNEHGSEYFEEFLNFLGDKIRLKGFKGYSGGLDVRDDTTGTHTTYNNRLQPYEILFHTSTMLPYTPNNRQQLMRKRHIGNDIVTIVFQDGDGCLPFNPKFIRSQFQHVFLVVRRICFHGRTAYRCAISRSHQVPSFGPELGSLIFDKNDAFLEFLLCKIINAENATLHRSEKFVAMATRTRFEYLKDLWANCSSVKSDYNNSIVASEDNGNNGNNGDNNVASTSTSLKGRFSILSIATKIKKSSKTTPPISPVTSPTSESSFKNIPGALSWKMDSNHYLILSSHYCILLLKKSNEEVIPVVTIETKSIVAWETTGTDEITLYHHTNNNYGNGGEKIILTKISKKFPTPLNHLQFTQKLQSIGTANETLQFTLRKNGAISGIGNFGMEIQNDGLITGVEEKSPAGVRGVPVGGRVVKVGGVAVGELQGLIEVLKRVKNEEDVSIVVVQPQQQQSTTTSCYNHLNLETGENNYCYSELYSPRKTSQQLQQQLLQQQLPVQQVPTTTTYYNSNSSSYCSNNSSSGYGTGSSSKSWTNNDYQLLSRKPHPLKNSSSMPPPPVPLRKPPARLSLSSTGSSPYYSYGSGSKSSENLFAMNYLPSSSSLTPAGGVVNRRSSSGSNRHTVYFDMPLNNNNNNYGNHGRDTKRDRVEVLKSVYGLSSPVKKKQYYSPIQGGVAATPTKKFEKDLIRLIDFGDDAPNNNYNQQQPENNNYNNNQQVQQQQNTEEIYNNYSSPWKQQLFPLLQQNNPQQQSVPMMTNINNPSISNNSNNTSSLETRVTLLEAQLLEEKMNKEELKLKLEKLDEENRLLKEEFVGGVKKELEVLRKRVFYDD